MHRTLKAQVRQNLYIELARLNIKSNPYLRSCVRFRQLLRDKGLFLFNGVTLVGKTHTRIGSILKTIQATEIELDGEEENDEDKDGDRDKKEEQQGRGEKEEEKEEYLKLSGWRGEQI